MLRRKVICDQCGEDYPPGCPHTCPGDGYLIPIIDCEMSDKVDGACNHPDNPIPECNATVCPRLSARVKEACYD